MNNEENKNNGSAPDSGCNQSGVSFDQEGINFRSFAETSLIGVFILQDGITKYVNKAIEQMMGYSREELCGKSPLVFTHPDDRDLVQTKIKERLAGKEGGPFEFSGFRKDGYCIWVRVMGGVITYEGRPALVGNMMDITHHKEVENELRASEKKYKTIVQNIMGMVYKAYPDWTAEIISNSLLLSGYTNDEINRMPHGWLDVVHPDDRALVEQEGITLAHERRSIIQVYRIIMKNGQTRWVEDHKASLFSEAGVFEGIEGVVIDITGRKRMEKALKESEDKFRNLFNNAEIGIFRTKVDGSEVLDVNDKFLDILGYDRKEVEGKPSLNYWIDLNERNEIIRRLKVQGRVSNFECRLLSKNGEIVNCLTSLKMYEKEGVLEGTIIDITERKSMENLLKENEVLLTRIFDQSPIGSAIVSMQGVFMSVNKSFCKMLGYTEQELKSMKYTDITHHDHIKEDMKNVMRMVRGEIDKYEVDKRYVKKDGSIIWGHLSLILLRDENNKPLYFLPMVIDINEKKIAEHQVKDQSKALEQKNTTLSELLERMTMEKDALTKKMTSNIEKMIMPKLSRLKQKSTDSQKRLCASIAKGIKDLSSAYGLKVTGKTASLTRRELEICSMIRDGYKNKEIADELYLSPKTIETIRKSIRKKLKIRNKTVNLESYLKTL